MKRLKKIISIGIAGLIVISGFGFANDITLDEKAQALNEIGVLDGDGTSFMLDKKLKRSEAAAFIVKVLGKNNEVMEFKNSYKNTSYSDVDPNEWYAPYIGYCSKEGIINGMGNGTFDPDAPLTEKQFFTLVLKAMGYGSDDFSWDTVNKAAYEMGLIDDITYAFKEEDNTDYYRSNVVELIYLSLSLKEKGGGKYFCENLLDTNSTTLNKLQKHNFLKTDTNLTAVKSISAISDTEIEIVLNEPVRTPKVENIKIFKKGNETKILKLNGVLGTGDTFKLITDTQVESQAYQVEIADVIDADSNTMEMLVTEFVGYEIPALMSNEFIISKVKPINKVALNVYFTHPVDEDALERTYFDIYLGENKFIEGGIQSISITRDLENPKLINIKLLNATLTDGVKYTLKIRGDLSSNYESFLGNEKGDSMDFVAVTGEAPEISINDVYSEEGKYVFVSFNGDLNEDLAKNRTNYHIKDTQTGSILTPSRISVGTEDKDKLYALHFSNIINGRQYEVIVKNMYDDYKINEIPEMRKTFSGSNKGSENIEAEYAVAIDSTTIQVYFKRDLLEISENASVSINNGALIVKKVLDDEDKKKMKLYLSPSMPVKEGKLYRIRFRSGLAEFTGKTQTQYYDYEIAGVDNKRDEIGVESASFITSNKIIVKFNQAISQSDGNASGKFEILHNDGNIDRKILPDVVKVVDQYTILVEIPYLLVGGEYTLKSEDIYDISNMYRSPAVETPIDAIYFD